MSTAKQFTRDPKFGYDGWPNADTSAPTLSDARGVHADILGGRVYAGADTIGGDINLLPAGLDMYASYVDNFGGYGELVARFGTSGAFLLSITIFGNPAVCADMEPGAMATGEFGSWLDSKALKNHGTPWGYTSAGNMAAVIAAAGGRKFIRWSAHYGHGPHICGPATCGFPQADWTQWDDHGAQGQNLDRSLGTYLPSVTPPPPPPPPPIPGGDMIASAYNPQLMGVEFAVAIPSTGEVQERRAVKPFDWHSLGYPFGPGVKGVQLTAAYNGKAVGTEYAAYNPHTGETKLRQLQAPHDWKLIGNPGH